MPGSITWSHEVALYVDDGGAVQARLSELGHTGVRRYAAADETVPLERLSNYDKLVHPGWVRDLLAGAQPEAAPPRSFLFSHVSFGVPEEYEEIHLPTAL